MGHGAVAHLTSSWELMRKKVVLLRVVYTNFVVPVNEVQLSLHLILNYKLLKICIIYTIYYKGRMERTEGEGRR